VTDLLRAGLWWYRRGHRRGSSASLPVDQLLLPVIRSASRGLALITAPAGGGKSTALQHLRAVIPADVAVRFFDVDQIAEARRVAATGWVVLAATDPQLVDGVVEVVQLSRWTLDDCLEYLHAKHPVDCASVLSRLSRDKSFEIMEGSPQLLTLVMDLMAGDASLDCGRGILRKQIRSILPSGDALDRLVIDGLSLAPLNSEQWRWWRHQAVQHICIASWLVQRLSDGVVSNQLHSMDEAAHLIPDIAAALHVSTCGEGLPASLYRQRTPLGGCADGRQYPAGSGIELETGRCAGASACKGSTVGRALGGR